VLHVALKPKCHFSLGLTNRFTAASVTVAMVVGPETGDNTNAPIRGELCDMADLRDHPGLYSQLNE